jgi:RimJ/RimL family protein N-acetyltransferase
VALLMAYAWGDRLPTLGSGRVKLRALTEDDAPALFAIFGDPQVARYWSSPPLEELAGALELVREIQDYFDKKTLFQWGVIGPDSDVVIGTCTLYRIETKHRRAEIGFALVRSLWGHGIMREALTTLIRFAFDDLGLERLEADADPRNDRSIRALEHQGFRHEGHLRERYHLAGEIQDAAYFGLLKREWRYLG